MGRLTEKQIDKLKGAKKEYWLTDEAPGRGTGKLCLRVLPSASKQWLIRVRRKEAGGYLRVGPFEPGATDHVSLTDARAALARVATALAGDAGVALDVLARIAKGGIPEAASPHIAVVLDASHPSHVQDTRPASDSAEETESRRSARARSLDHSLAPADVTQGPTLQEIVDRYVRRLQAQGKVRSANDARSCFARHIGHPHPELAGCPAALLRAEDIVDVLAAIVQLGKRREAERLRSLLGTVYRNARGAALDPNVPRDNGVRDAVGLHNAMAGVAAVKHAKNARRRILNNIELGEFSRLIRLIDTPAARAVDCAILLGGQRCLQLLRARCEDLDQTDWTLMLLARKGGANPRGHTFCRCSVEPRTFCSIAIAWRGI